MKRVLKSIKKIEKKCYPKHMRMFGECRTWSDLIEYCEGEPDVYLTPHFYCVVTRGEGEIVDLASTRPLSLKEMNQLARWLGSGTWKADLRKSTSLPLLRALEKWGRIQLRELHSWMWGGEEMVEVEISLP